MRTVGIRGVGFTAIAAAAGAGGVPTDRTVVVGTEFRMTTGTQTQAGPWDTEVFRVSDCVGSAPVTHVGLLLPNFCFASGTGGFFNAPGYTIDTVYVSFTVGGTLYAHPTPLTWAGATSKAVAAGEVAGSDLISIATITGGAHTQLPVGTVVYFNGLRKFPVGGGVTTQASGLTSMTGVISGRTTVASFIYSSASGATPTGLSGGGAVNVSGTKAVWILPLMTLIGRFATPAISVLEFSDSIGHGVGDPTNPAANKPSGFMHRARHVGALGIGKIAGIRISSNGSNAVEFTDAPTYLTALLQYCNVLADEMGRNTQAFEAAERASHTALWNAAYDAGVSNILKIAMFPNAGSTDGWLTTVNQSPDTTYSPQRDTWYASQLQAGALVRGKVNYWCDLASTRAATTGTDRWKWAVNGSTSYAWDAIHPSPVGHAAGADDYRATLLSITP